MVEAVSLELSIALIVIGVILWAISKMSLPPPVASALYWIGIALLVIGIILLIVWIVFMSGYLLAIAAPLLLLTS
jgi:hypothetical protein